MKKDDKITVKDYRAKNHTDFMIKKRKAQQDTEALLRKTLREGSIDEIIESVPVVKEVKVELSASANVTDKIEAIINTLKHL
jgi:hypothetical protein